ncbi:hypothetical protein Tco_0422907 [Tanacetum coccineum]
MKTTCDSDTCTIAFCEKPLRFFKTWWDLTTMCCVLPDCDLSILVAFCSKKVEVCPRFLRFAQRNIAFCLDKVLRFAIEICIQQKDFKEYTFCEPDTYRRDLLKNLDTLEAVIHKAVITYGRLQLLSQDVQINPVQAVDDRLIVSKSSGIESENNNALSKSVNETQLQQHESLVTESTTVEANLTTDVKALDAGSVITESSGTKSDKHDTSSNSGTFITHAVDADIRPVIGQGCHLLRNSQEEPYDSNDMAHNHYLEEARKKTQERNKNSKPSMMHTTSLQNTTNGSKPNPRSNNQISRSLPVSKSSCGMSNGVSLVDHSRNSSSFSDSKHFVCSTCHKCVFNANHDNCITKFLKEVNSRAKVQSPKTRNNTKPVEPKSHTQKPSRQIAIGQRFSPKKSSAVHEKPNTPRSCLRWKPTGRIFKIVGLRWIPTGKMFTDYTTKVDSEPPNGSNDDITNPYECDQTLNVGAGTANLSAGLALQRQMASADNTSGPVQEGIEILGAKQDMLTLDPLQLSNDEAVGRRVWGSPIPIVSIQFYRNPVKEIPLKRNLPDHSSALTDPEDQAKLRDGDTSYMWNPFHHTIAHTLIMEKSLALDFKTFVASTGLDYNQGTYVDHPSPKVVKAELAKISTTEALVQKNPVLKTTFLVAWRIMFTFVI